MKELGIVMALAGVLLISAGIAIASFKLNWIFGIAVLGFILIVLGSLLAGDNDDFYDD